MTRTHLSQLGNIFGGEAMFRDCKEDLIWEIEQWHEELAELAAVRSDRATMTKVRFRHGRFAASP